MLGNVFREEIRQEYTAGLPVFTGKIAMAINYENDTR